MRRKNAFFLVFLALAVLLGMAGGTQATGYLWTDGNGGAWGTPGNWNPNGVPNAAGDTATINDGTSTVNVNGSYALTQMMMASGNAVNINNGFYLNLYTGGTDPFIDGGTVRLMGAGDSRLRAYNLVTIKAGTVVDMVGAGSRLDGAGGFTNQGAIQGQGNIDTTVTNQGTIQAVDGNINVAAVTINNSGGVMSANGYNLILNGTTVTGGQLNPDLGTLTLNNPNLHYATIGAGNVTVNHTI